MARVSKIIKAYRTDPDSSYRDLRYATRIHYKTLSRRLTKDLGRLQVSEVNARLLLRWNASIIAAGHGPMAHALVGMLRIVVHFGATVREDKDCNRLSSVLHQMRFKMGKPRTQRLTSLQARDICARANKVRRGSIALAQAIATDFGFRQKDIIGEWVPEKEPGASAIHHEGSKWLRGVRWEEIGPDLKLRHVTSKRLKLITLDFRLARTTLAQLKLDPSTLTREQLPENGPIVICESTKRPWVAGEFRRWWRKIARAAKVPDEVRFMDTRSGTISDMIAAGATIEQARQAATHSDSSMTQRYSRGDEENVAEAQRLLVDYREKLFTVCDAPPTATDQTDATNNAELHK